MKRLVPALLLVLTVLLASWHASAATYTGSNLAGANLTLVNGDVVSGVFTNVGTFTIPAGAVVTVAPGVAFEMHATTINIAGTLDATGAGFLGGTMGLAAAAAPHPGGAGGGPGGGGGGSINGCNVHPSGGGGAGYAAAGGGGGVSCCSSVPGAGGAAYGTASLQADKALGSGGGGGGGDCSSNGDGGAGGTGGGSVVLDATTVTVGGTVLANGASGVVSIPVGGAGGGGGGGGSGGTIEVIASTLNASGSFAANGGNGANGTWSLSGGGGGGNGGRVKVFATASSAITSSVTGGIAGTNSGLPGVPASAGGAGTVYIAPITTTTTVSSLTNPSVNGQSVTFSAHVTGGATGMVTFRAGGVAIGTGTLNGAGDAAFSTSALPIGTSSIDAVYAGDSIHGGSNSAAFNQVVNKASSATTLMSSQNPSIINGSVTFTATVAAVAPGTGTPTGSIAFTDGGVAIGMGALDGSGVATLTLSNLALGAHTVVATFTATATLTGSASTPLTQTVNKDGETITLASSLNPSTFGTSVTFTATLTTSGSGGAPTGSVTFKDGAANLGVGVIAGATATYTTSALTAGAHAVTAVYGGDATHVAGTSAALNQQVDLAATTGTLVSSVNPTSFGQSTTFTATFASAAAGSLAGTATFKDGVTTLGSVAVSAGGVASYPTSALVVGSHDITAVYSGNANFSTSTTAVLSQVVNKANTATALISSSNPSLINANVTFTATVTTAGAGTPTGNVTFKDGATVLGTGVVGVGGTATYASAALAVGSHTITAVYEGDGSFATSTSAPVTQAVDLNGSSVALASSANPSVFGTNVTFTATVTGTAATPTGTITFKDGATVLGTGTLNGSAVATFATAALTTGSHTINAVYGGNATYLSGPTGTLAQVVKQAASTTAIASSLNPSKAGDDVTFTATVTSPAAGAGGNVEFFDGTTSLGSKPLVGSAATFATSTLTIGGHAMSAVYAGDTNHATSTSSMLAQTVDQAASNPGADAGVGGDAGTIHADGGFDAGVSDAPAGDSGCGCHTTPSSSGGALAALPLLGLALLIARRRRRA